MTLLYTSIVGEFRLMNQAFMGFLLEELKVNGLKYLHKILAIFFQLYLSLLWYIDTFGMVLATLSLVISLVVGFTSKYFSMYN